MSSQHLRHRSHQGAQYKHRGRQQCSDDKPKSEPGLSNGVIILAIAIVVGCFAVLWPKIFSPMLFGEPVINTKPIDEAMFMEGPHGREFLNSAMKERMRLAAHPGAHPETGESQGRGRLHPPGAGRMSPPIRTMEKEWGGKGGPMPGMRPTMGGPGIQPQQPKGGGTMGVVMPIYTIAIIIFFVYTTMKVMFKNKNNDDEEEDTTDRMIGDNGKYDEEYYNNYIKQFTKNVSKSSAPHQTEETISHDTASKIKTDNIESKQNYEEPYDHVGDSTNIKENGTVKSSTEESNIQTLEPKSEQSSTEKESIPNTNDPRDLEIILLKARLEQTEKAMEKIVAQMGIVSAYQARDQMGIVSAQQARDQMGIVSAHQARDQMGIVSAQQARDQMGIVSAQQARDQMGIVSAQQARDQMGILSAQQDRDQTFEEDQASYSYSGVGDLSKEECDCETCEGKFDATYNDEDETENICELEEEYLAEGFTNYDDDTDDDSPSE